MRLSDLLGCAVKDATGTVLGHVTDVRLAQIGRLEGASAELVVESLLVSPRNTGALFGYERRSEQGPWLVRAVVRRLHRGAVLIPWSDVGQWDRDERRIELAQNDKRSSP
jgi:sporulation protein YlmC with PRC-barrel domain